MHAVSMVSDSALSCLEELYRRDEADQLACTWPRHVAKIMRDELFAVLRASVITATEIGPEHVNDAMTRGTLEQALTSRAAPMIRLASVGDPTTIVRYLVCTFAKWPELGEVLLTTVQCSECANGILALSPDQATLFIPLLQLLVAQGRLPKAAQNAAKDGLYRLGTWSS